MSSPNAESVTAAAVQGAHLVVTEEVAGGVIADVALHQGT